MADDIGNRRKNQDVYVPADDIGNRLPSLLRPYMQPDDVGNSIAGKPTHLQSGVMGNMDSRRRQPQQQRANMPAPSQAPSNRPVKRPAPAAPERAEKPVRESRKPSRDNIQASMFEDEERQVYVLKSDPEVKRALAENTVRQILAFVMEQAIIEAALTTDNDQPCVVVSVEEKTGEGLPEPMLRRGNVALSALNFIVNKIVNRYPDDRIRLLVVPKSDAAALLKPKPAAIVEPEVTKKEPEA